MNLPENPLDQIVNYFRLRAMQTGDDTYNVVEVTGRKKILEKEIGMDPNSKYYFTGKIDYVKRSPEGFQMKKANFYEMENFQQSRKRIAIISDAGSIGISLHASKWAKK